MDEDEDARIARLLEEALGPPPPKPADLLTTRTLDEVLASRTHVRVLRVLVTRDPNTNLTARALARSTETSHARVLPVLRQLGSLGLVTVYWGLGYSLYWLTEEHPLIPHIRSLFEEERRWGVSSRREPP